jgi:hypothetical protein
MAVSVHGNDELKVSALLGCLAALLALLAIVQFAVGEEAWIDERTGRSVIRRALPGRGPPRESHWRCDSELRTAAISVPTFSTWSGHKSAMGIALISGGRVFLLAVLEPGSEIDRYVEGLPSSIASRVSTESVLIVIQRMRVL